MKLSRLRVVVFVLATVVLSSACSGSVSFSFGGQSAGEAAIELIEGDEMAQQLMLGSITDAVCDEPASDADGTVFLCTAQSTGDIVQFEVTLEAGDRIFAAPTNVVAAKFLDGYAATAVQALNEQNPFTLPDGAIDCGSESVVLDANNQMTCVLTDAENGAVFGALLTIDDVESGTFGVEIVEAE